MRRRDRDVVNLDDREMFDNPYPVYADLRRSKPVAQCRVRMLVRGQAYMLTRFDDVSMVYTDPRFSSDMNTHSGVGRFSVLMPNILRLLTDSMVFKDDPEHKRLKNLVHKAFTPKTVRAMHDDIVQIVDDQLDVLAAKRDVDLVEDYAVQIPLTVIATMMGISESERDNFHRWVSKVTEGAAGRPLELLGMLPTANRLMRLFADLAEQARLNPDGRLVSALVGANEDGDKLSDREILAMTFLLLLAGHDTSTHLIGSSVLALIDHPDQLALLRSDPAVMKTGIEELLRYTVPVPFGTTRYALEDVEVGGTVIPAGSQVLGMIISANRDESVIERPDELDLTRPANKHISFALGPHYCLGHQLARMEGSIAITRLVQRFDTLDLAVPHESLRYRPTAALRGLLSLPMRVA